MRMSLEKCRQRRHRDIQNKEWHSIALGRKSSTCMYTPPSGTPRDAPIKNSGQPILPFPDLELARKKAERNLRRAELMQWGSLLAIFVPPVVAILLLWPQKPVVERLESASTTVHVSSYTRSDGTFVSEHQRAQPGERSLVNAINQPIIARNLKRRSEHSENVARAWIVGCGVLLVTSFVCPWLYEELRCAVEKCAKD